MTAFHRITVVFSDGEECAFSFSRLDLAQESAERFEKRKDVVSVKYLGPNAPVKKEQFEGSHD